MNKWPMSKIIMLPVRQKQVFQTIKNEGFDPFDFLFEPLTNDQFSITYRPNEEYNFSKSKTPNQNSFVYIPGHNGALKTSFNFASFQHLLKQLTIWLSNLKENISVGNPWQEIHKLRGSLEEFNVDSYEEMFSDEESILARDTIQSFSNYLEEIKVETSLIRKDLDHLSEMISKVSRKDWLFLFLGTITSWLIGGLIPPEEMGTVWDKVKTLFAPFINKLLQ